VPFPKPLNELSSFIKLPSPSSTNTKAPPIFTRTLSLVIGGFDNIPEILSVVFSSLTTSTISKYLAE